MIRLHKRTRYGLYAAMGVAGATEAEPVTAAQVAQRFSIPAPVLAKALQQLVREGLAVGTRGLGGGYRLASRASEVTVLDVVRAFEPPRAPGQCLLEDRQTSCAHPDECNLRRLFDEVDEQVRYTFASITLDTLLRRPRPDMGLRQARTSR